MTINVLVLEPDLFRLGGIISCLSREVDFRVIGAGEYLVQAMDSVSASVAPDVVVVNLDHMSKMKSWAILSSILPEAKVVGLTDGRNIEILENALATRVAVLLHLEVDCRVLCKSIRGAVKGIIFYDPLLVDRAKSVLMEPARENQIRFGGLIIDLERQEVACWGKFIHLTLVEFKVLVYLARKQGKHVSSAELLDAIWRVSPDLGGTTDQVKSCIKRLRQKVEPDARNPRYIKSVRGRGYVLSDPLDSEFLR